MSKYICKLCNFESSSDAQDDKTIFENYGVCYFCVDDIYSRLKAPHHFGETELQLRINLRKLRHNLQKVTCLDKNVNSVLDSVQVEVNAIERQLGSLDSDYPSLSEVLSEYRSLLRVYK